MNKSLELLSEAVADFLNNQQDDEKFMALDWLLRVTLSKWESYSLGRRVEAAKQGGPLYSPCYDR